MICNLFGAILNVGQSVQRSCKTHYKMYFNYGLLSNLRLVSREVPPFQPVRSNNSILWVVWMEYLKKKRVHCIDICRIYWLNNNSSRMQSVHHNKSYSIPILKHTTIYNFINTWQQQLNRITHSELWFFYTRWKKSHIWVHMYI